MTDTRTPKTSAIRAQDVTRAAQAVVTAYYVRVREDGLGMEQADMDLGNAVDRLYRLVGEVPIER